MVEAEDASVTAAMLFPVQAEALRLSSLLGASAETEERNLERFEALLKPYQELPQALDQCLAELSNNLMLRIHTSPSCCRGMYLLCKIRGRKSVSRLLPKQVHYLDEAIELLAANKCWESKYVGLVWLSLLILLPFELDSITDTSVQGIQQIIVSFLGDDRPTRDPASLCLAKLLTRPDCHEEMLQFLQEDTEEIGLLLAKAAVFKRTSNWQDVAGLAVDLFPRILQQCLLHFDSSNAMRKIVYVKLLQRMFTTTQGLDMEHCEVFANFILTRALGDADSRVRWQAAKSTRRFVENGIMEVYEAVLDLFTSEQQDEDLWHGACLAVGEMIRTRKINLLIVKPTIHKCIANALGFDRKRGTRSLGSNIRDAGCYVTWALVRCFPKACFAVEDCTALAELLLVTSLFDREVSCRRAASAALQETVGRLGLVPHGINLLLLVSYQSVGNVNRAYREVCAAVCQFPVYKQPLIDHLLQVKTRHWDETIRTLASEALGRNGNAEALQLVLERISQQEINQFELHGGLLACAELVKNDRTCTAESVAAALEHTAMLITTVFPAQLVMLRNAWLALFQAACEMLPHHGLEQHAQFVENCLKQEETCHAATYALTALLKANNTSTSGRWMFNVYALHACLLAGVNLNQVLPRLAECLHSRMNSHTDRIQALVALSNVNDLQYVDVAFSHCLLGLEDTTHSNQHGDVGSWVRRQACLSLCSLYKNTRKRFTALQFAIHRCAYFACDKLDHVREAAVLALFELTEEQNDESFYTLEQSFQRVTRTFLLTPTAAVTVQTSILCSLLLTAGSLNESPSQAAQDCLEVWYLDHNTTAEARMRLYDAALFLLRRAEEAQTIAVCKSLTFVLFTLAHHCLPPLHLSPVWRVALVDLLTTTTQKRRRMSISRQVAVAQVLLGLMTDQQPTFWPEFTALLTSEYPSLRKQVAEAFYLWASGLPNQTPSLRQAMDMALTLWQDDDKPKLQEIKQAFLICMC